MPRLAVAILLVLFPTARAVDRFLSIGGGPAPATSQVSLEKNILFWQRILADLRLDGLPHDIYFGAGPAPSRLPDVVFNDPNAAVPRANELLATLTGRESDLFLSYRHNQIQPLRGPANRQAITQWFERVGPTMADGDRLILYFTGHGGRGNPARNTTLDLWNDQPLSVRDFTSLLDRLSPRVQVVLVMVQCHSGGFADVIFKDAQAGGALSPARRCGFFATAHDRLAAGCTPDIEEEDYHDYSTSFFAALYGHTRTGGDVPNCDYDGDGRVSFAEAHAYAQLSSDTVDIPLTTSDNLLRQFSRAAAGGFTANSPFSRLARMATPAQRAVLDGLSTQLELAGEDRARAARGTADAVDRQRKSLDRDRNRLNRDLGRARNEIRYRVRQRWPELSNAYHPKTPVILKEDADRIVKQIESDPSYARMQQLTQQINDLDDRSGDMEKKWVKCQRLLQTLETLALSANLERTAPANVTRRYAQLLEQESGTLTRR